MEQIQAEEEDFFTDHGDFAEPISDFDVMSDGEITRQIITSQNNEMRQLESDMHHLSEIFNTLSCMVDFQGEKLDVAETNVETTSINVQEATAHIENAVEYQSGITKKLIGGALVCGGVTIGGVALIFLSPVAGILTASVGVTGAIGCSVAGLVLKK